jgi:hypothetical protein
MIIIISKEGQLCNRLFHFAHQISYAIETGQIIWHPFFNEFSNYFPNLSGRGINKVKIYLWSNSVIRVLMSLSSSILNFFSTSIIHRYIFSDGAEIILSEQYSKPYKKILFCHGWLLRDYKNFAKHADTLKLLFEFRSEVILNTEKILKHLKSDKSQVIGLHIRRGDYLNWEGGKHFYTDEQYSVFLRKLTDLMTFEGKKIKFIIFSNEALSNTSPLLKYSPFVANGTAIEDLSLLSRCDYIVGPPSSYSSWASFIGNTPLLHIKNAKQNFSIGHFSINNG